MCKNWREKGQCRYGDKCLFAHGDHELTKRSSSPVKKQQPAESIKEDQTSKDTKNDAEKKSIEKPEEQEQEVTKKA